MEYGNYDWMYNLMGKLNMDFNYFTMKKHLYQLLVALIALSSLFLVSCNDEEDISSGDIVGTWEWDSFDSEDYWGKQYVQFNADGEYIEVNLNADGTIEYIDRGGQWERIGNTVIISDEGEEIPTTAVITKLSNEDLTLTLLGISMSYKRVDDSVIEKYLNY